jgi:glycyl-tRNA synthetase beta chain
MNPLLLEIGTEEIPAGYIQPALGALADTLTAKLSHARIDHGPIQTYGTPRRLVVTIKAVADRQRPVSEDVLGPPERIAFDGQGQPTVPAQKFAEKTGVAVSRLKVVETEKGRYLAAKITDKGKAVRTVLRDLLPEAILATPFPKTMRWSDLAVSFARPIQSVVALLGTSVISFSLDKGLKSGRFSWGHMFMSHKKIKIDHPDNYAELLTDAGVIVAIDERKELVRKKVDTAAKALGGHVLEDEALLDINTNLVESVFTSGGRFDDGFLELPPEILITSMREHQKYFAVVDANGKLMPCFIAVNNTQAVDMDLVTTGHERVLRARLSDAKFFYQSDIKAKMDDWRDQLKGVLFQAKLGSMYAKVDRVAAMGECLADMVGGNEKQNVVRAAQLCKTDLVSEVVGEFPSLQGIMGRIYAKVAGESPEVALAIEEHYRPTYSGGPLPETRTGALLAIADKLDTICGCFAVGLVPTGASDPYALRRQAIGIAHILLNQQFHFSLHKAVETCVGWFEQADQSATVQAVMEFIQNRIAHMLAEEGYAKDVIAAVAGVSVDNIPNVWNRTKALHAMKADRDFEPLAAAFKRVVNILRKANPDGLVGVNEALFEAPAEGALNQALQKVRTTVDRQLASADFEGALRTIATLRDTVDQFFEDVMVMAEDQAIQQNRLALLGAIAALFDQIADFSKLSTGN